MTAVLDSKGGTNFLFPVSSGLLTGAHRRKMRGAIWEFLWFIDRTTSDDAGCGIVLGGQPITDARIAQFLGSSERTVRANCQRLRAHGYIRKRTPQGLRVWVAKSKKFAWRRAAENRRSVDQRAEENSYSDRHDAAAQTGRNTPAYIDNTPDHTEDRKQAPQFTSTGRAWKALRLSYPIGCAEFRTAWESLFERGDREHLNLLMEQCISYCRDQRIKTPPEFFKLKHRVEDSDDEIVKLAVHD